MTAVATLSPMGRAGVQYAIRGVVIAPRIAGARAFCIRGWIEAGTTDADVIARWWSCWPDAEPAAVLGRSGLVVVDVDRHPGQADGFESLVAAEARLGPLPRTATVATPRGGEHRWFRCAVPGARSVIVAPSLELKGGRTGTSLPPARGYRWIDRTPAAVLPAAWAALVTPPPPPPPRPARQVCSSSSYARTAIRNEVGKVLCAAHGTRNPTLNNAAFALGQLVGADLASEREVTDALLDAGAAAGLPLSEVRSVVRRGLRAGVAHPRQVRTRGGASCW